MNYRTKINDISHESGGISIPKRIYLKRSAIAIATALIIMLGVTVLSLVGCPDDTGSGTDTVSDTTAPAKITGLAQALSGDGTSVTLSWTNPADADLQTIQITVTPVLSSFPLRVPANGASMEQSEVVTGLTVGTNYVFAVLTIDATGNVGASSDAPTVISSPDATAPGQVTDVTAVLFGNRVTLSWTNPTDADLSYISIEWTPTTSGPMQPIETARTTPVATTQAVAGLTASTLHTFTLVAVDASGNKGDLSSAATVDATTGSPGFTAIAAGRQHTCVLRGGEAFCWGGDGFGQLGNGATTGEQATPVAVTLTGVSAISAANFHNCVIAGNDDTAYCWGRGNDGRLGNGFANNNGEASPVAVLSGESGAGTNLTDVSAISAGDNFSCAIVGNDDTAYCWGREESGRLGNGAAANNNQLSPVAVLSGESGAGTNLTDVSAISAGASHTCAIAGADDGAYCWGDARNGRVGNGATSGNQTAPVAVMGPLGTTGPLIGVTAISTGAQHACAIANGTAYCWGNGGNGRLGSNTTDDQSRPVLVVAVGETGTPPASGADSRAPLAAVTSIDAVHDANIDGPRSCAVAGATGIVYCWGNGSDALGIGASAVSQLRPAAVQGVGGTGMLSGILAISAGAQHTCAVSPDAAYCWGVEAQGDLGNGATTGNQSSPVDITSFIP